MKQERRPYSTEEKAKSSLEAISCQQRSTLEKRNAREKRQRRGCCGSTDLQIVVARRSSSEISGGNWWLQSNNENLTKLCEHLLKVVDTRRDAYRLPLQFFQFLRVSPLFKCLGTFSVWSGLRFTTSRGGGIFNRNSRNFCASADRSDEIPDFICLLARSAELWLRLLSAY
jgi:hypothetical protein